MTARRGGPAARRALLLALAAVVTAAGPASPAWTAAGSGQARGTAATLRPLAEPRVASACNGLASIGLTVMWTPDGSPVTGFEVYRVRDGVTTLLADLPPSATATADTQPVGVSLAYFVTHEARAWRASSPRHTVTGLPSVCT